MSRFILQHQSLSEISSCHFASIVRDRILLGGNKSFILTTHDVTLQLLLK